MLVVPGTGASAMVQKLPLVGFGPCRHAVPSWVGRVVPVASVGVRPGCGVVCVGRHGPLWATEKLVEIYIKNKFNETMTIAKLFAYNTLVMLLFVSCNMDSLSSNATRESSQTVQKNSIEILHSIAGPQNSAGISRVVHIVLVDSVLADSIEAIVLPQLTSSSDDNMNQYFIHTSVDPSFKFEIGTSLPEAIEYAKGGSIALINKSKFDDGVVLYEY